MAKLDRNETTACHIFLDKLTTMNGQSNYNCPYCNKRYNREQDLDQHLEKNTVCIAIRASKRKDIHGDNAAYMSIPFGRNVRRKTLSSSTTCHDNVATEDRINVDQNIITARDKAIAKENRQNSNENDENSNNFYVDQDNSSDEEDSESEEDSEEEDSDLEEEDSDEEEDSAQEEQETVQPDTEILDNFKEYVANAQKNFLELPKRKRDALELMFCFAQIKGLPGHI